MQTTFYSLLCKLLNYTGYVKDYTKFTCVYLLTDTILYHYVLKLLILKDETGMNILYYQYFKDKYRETVITMKCCRQRDKYI